MKHQKNIILVISFMCSVSVFSQTVNVGELYVSQNTVMSIVEDFNNTATGTLENNGDVYAYSNWNNDNQVNFDPAITGTSNGLTRFVGLNVQTISGSQFSFFNNTLFDNTTAQPAFQLSGMVSVATESNFANGIVDNDNFGGQFVFEDDATHINTSDDSHVDGYVVKAGDDEFRYPIGDSNYYRFSAISEPDTTTDELESKYFFEDTNTNYPISNLSGDLVLIDADEHWEVLRVSGNSEVLVTLSWRDVTTPSEILAAPLEAIHIARWDSVLQVWVDEGGVVDIDNQTVTTVVEMDTFGVFTLARVDVDEVLPCGLKIDNTLVTPNGDNINDYFNIDVPQGSTCISNINVKIYNRWGVKVFEGDNYGLGGELFNGFSQGRATLEADKKLPTGTYFYILTVNYNSSNSTTDVYKETDYLYVNGD